MRTRPFHVLLALWSCCAGSVPPAAAAPRKAAAAQAAQLPRLSVSGLFTFKSYGPDQGLNNLAVNQVVQDAQGLLWVATEDGVYRFDGQRFHRYGPEEGLPSAAATSLSATRDGALWVVTSSGAARWNRGRFTPVTESGLPGGVPGVLEGAEGGYAVASVDDRVFEARNGGPFRPMEGLPPGGLSSAWAAPGGAELLLAQRRILWMRQGGQWQSRDLNAFLKDGIHQALKDRRGRIWVRTRHSLLRLDGPQAPPLDLSAALGDPPLATAFLAEDGLGRMWTNTALGLVCFQEDGWWPLGEREGLPTAWAATHFIDREGTLWVGSEGLHRLQGRFLWSVHTRRQGLPADTVWAVCRSREGRVYAGTSRGAARRTERGWETLPGTEGRLFYSVAEHARDGSVWFGAEGDRSHPGTLFVLRPGAGRVQAVPMASCPPTATVMSLAATPEGPLLVATLGAGLHRILPQGASWRAERVPVPGLADDDQINQVGCQGQLRWATTMKGLAVDDGQGFRLLGLAEGLKELQVITAAPTPQGDLWIAYWNRKGLSRLHREQGQWRVAQHLDGPERLVKDMLYSLRVDPSGQLWLGTGQGVKRWDGARLECFGRGEGLPGEDCTQNAIWQEPGGDLWVGTSNGLAQFHAGAYLGPPQPPPARLLALRDGQGRSLDLEGGEVAIPWRHRNITVDYAAPSYLNESRISFQVRLEGFEDVWRDTQIREARYTALWPGSYRFEVRSRDASGVLGPPQSLAFRILPPWWLRWWSLLGFAALGTGLVFLGVRLRTARLIRQKQQLEEQVRERTRALEQANRALEEASMLDPLTGLKNRRFLALSLPEEVARVQRIFGEYRRAGKDPRGQREDMVFLMIDLDHFKGVNDTYGHAAGDEVLRQTAALLRAACREGDSLVRWGGEEFLLVAKRTNREGAEAIARNLRDAVRAHPFDLGLDEPLRRTCSIGFCPFPVLPGEPERFQWEEALEVADQCLYAAKRSGRDAYVGVLCRPETDTGVLRARLLSQAQVLAREGLLEVQTSLPDFRTLDWKEP